MNAKIAPAVPGREAHAQVGLPRLRRNRAYRSRLASRLRPGGDAMTAQVKVQGYLGAPVYVGDGKVRSCWQWRWECRACGTYRWRDNTTYRAALDSALHHAETCPAVKIADMRDRYRAALESSEAAYAADLRRWEAERARLCTDRDAAQVLIAAAREATKNHPDPRCLLDDEPGVSCGWKDAYREMVSILAPPPDLPPCPFEDCDADPEVAAHHFPGRSWDRYAQAHTPTDACDEETGFTTHCYSARAAS